MNCAPPRMSPPTQMPSTLVLRRSSASTIPFSVVSRPTFSRPRSSVFGIRPVAIKRCEASSSEGLSPPRVIFTPWSVFSTFSARVLCRNSIPSSSRMFLESLRHLLVFAGCHAAGAAGDDGYAAAHAAVELAHLQPDNAAPDYGDVLREIRVLQPVAGVYVVHLVQAVYRGDQGARPGI